MEKPGVMVVEDSQTIVQVIEGILKKHGYPVVATADTGEEALRLAIRLKPDIVLMDISLKGAMDGIETAERLTTHHKIPVIFLTSNSDTTILESALKSEGSSYLLKPVNETELIFNLEITLQKAKTEKVVQEEKQWREAILESIIDGVIAENARGEIIFMNTPARTLLEVMEGFHSRQIKDYAWFYDMEGNAVSVLDGPDRRIECQMKILTGKSYYVILKIQTIMSPAGYSMGKAITITNITEERVMMDRIRYLTFHDNLTGLYNRNYLEEELVRLNTVRQHPLSIIMADLNGLKIMNDILGHTEGDLILKACGKLLHESCRGEDIISRFGGDEFLILLPNTEADQAREIMRRISTGSQRIETPFGALSVAVGSHTKSDLEETMQESIIRADDDMYRNKTGLKKEFYRQCFDHVYGKLQAHPFEGSESSQEVKTLLMRLAKTCQLVELKEEDLGLMVDLYDIGMTCLPPELLERQQLEEGDWERIRRHAEMSYKIVNLNPDAAHVAEAILYHHERWDGRGYPYRLKGKAIPLASRLLAVADAYHAMTRKRPYRKTLSHREALHEIARGAGNQFDPWVVDQFMNVMSPGRT